MGIPVFCDWLKLRMAVSHAPIGTNYLLAQYNPDVGIDFHDWQRPAWVSHVKKPESIEEYIDTSSSSMVKLRYNQESGFLDVDGNLGRWGRTNNVWNYGVYGSAWRFLPEILKPPVSIVGDIRIKRIDLTANVAFKSATDAYAYLRWCAMQKLHRINPTQHTTGVTWVTENWSLKVYDKINDLNRHKQKNLSELLISEVGYILRIEATLRSDELQKWQMDLLSNWQHNDEMMQRIFMQKFEQILKNDVMIDEMTNEMPTRLSTALDSWRSGRNFPAMVADGKMSRATYYRLRRDLQGFGFDISQPCNVTALNIRPRQVDFSFIDAPSWYWKKRA